jgi:hypothetical protein
MGGSECPQQSHAGVVYAIAFFPFTQRGSGMLTQFSFTTGTSRSQILRCPGKNEILSKGKRELASQEENVIMKRKSYILFRKGRK